MGLSTLGGDGLRGIVRCSSLHSAAARYLMGTTAATGCMKDRFMRGLDSEHVNYAEVDADASLDDLQQVLWHR